MPLDKFSTKVLSEGYTTGIEDEKQIDSLDTPIDKDLLKSLFRELKKSGLDIPFAVDPNTKPNAIKIRDGSFDLDGWKKKNDITVAKTVLSTGQGSVNSTGGTLRGAEWEVIICVAYNMKSQGVSKNEAIALAEAKWKPDYESAMDMGHKMVENAFGKNPKGVMKHFGSDNVNLTKEWDQFFLDATGSSAPTPTRTPKTDMYIGNQRISLKKDGGSQLMSGGIAEALATLHFTYEQIPSKIKTKEFDKAFNQLTEDVANKFTKLPVEKGKNVTSYKKEIRAGIQSKVHDEVSRILEEHSAMQDAVRDIFYSLEARKAIAYESMTGKSKFEENIAKATHIMVFDPVTAKASYKIIDDKLVTEVARQIEFQINFKTGGGGSKPYTNLRITIPKVPKILKHLLEDSFKETEDQFLSEGIDPFSLDVINEGILGNIKNKLKDFFKKFVSTVLNKIKALFIKSYNMISQFTNKKISIRKDPKVTWKI